MAQDPEQDLRMELENSAAIRRALDTYLKARAQNHRVMCSAAYQDERAADHHRGALTELNRLQLICDGLVSLLDEPEIEPISEASAGY